MAIKPRWSTQPDKNFGFGESGGSWNSPFEADWYWIGVVFMVKIFLCFFIKRKGYKYEDELGSKEIWQPFPSNGARKLVGIS